MQKIMILSRVQLSSSTPECGDFMTGLSALFCCIIFYFSRATFLTYSEEEYKAHMLRGSGSTVVMITSKVNGKMEILTPYRSETPENIETKIGQNDYVVGPLTLLPATGGEMTPVWFLSKTAL